MKICDLYENILGSWTFGCHIDHVESLFRLVNFNISEIKRGDLTQQEAVFMAWMHSHY